MNPTRNQIIIIGAIGLVAIFFILVFLGVIPGLKKSGSGGGFQTPGNDKKTAVNFWGIIDNDNDRTAIQSLIEEYQKTNQGVKIDFTAFDNAKNYEKALLNALATGKAPDIFMFHNTWLPKYFDKITPLPEIAFPLSQLRQLFPQVVEQDFVLQQTHSASSGQAQDKSLIVALPLYIDTLALLYNKNIFDGKAIALPPTNWQSFQNMIPYLRETNLSNQIIKPAAAIGGSEKSIDSASDLLNLLMMQLGSLATDNYGKISFSREGLPALDFYLQFSNPNSPYYTWSDNLKYSLDSFSEGSTAIIFNYASRIPLIKSKNPYLNIGVAPMLQSFGAAQDKSFGTAQDKSFGAAQDKPANANQPINYADYWGLSVSNQSQYSDLSWNFILFAATNPQANEVYLQTAKKPPALRSLISKYINDQELGIFSRQALTARSWRQPDSATVKQIFSDMIESILNSRLNTENALRQAENEINSL